MTKLTRSMLLDAAAKWYGHCAGSPNYTREARQAALEAQRQALSELEPLGFHPEGEHNSGYYGVASNSRDYGAASNSGTRGAASNSGNFGAASNSGYYGVASNSGNYGAASNSGTCGAASNSGDYGAASNSGTRGAAFSHAPESKVMCEGDGQALYCTEFAKDGRSIKSVTCGITGRDGIKAGVWYVCKDGKLVEAE